MSSFDLRDPNIFNPIQVGHVRPLHRAVMPPLSRMSTIDSMPLQLESLPEYYGIKSQTPGTLVIVESTLLSPPNNGEVVKAWTPQEMEFWRQIFEQIHMNNSYVFVQLANWGSPADANDLAESFGRVSLNANGTDSGLQGTDPSNQEFVDQFVRDYVQAAQNCILAGADGVEIHHVNGSLLNQFLDPQSNTRADDYGGSIGNRARLTLRVVEALANTIGVERVGISFSPYASSSHFLSVAQYAYILGELERSSQDGNRLAYVHLEEPVSGSLPPEGQIGPNQGAGSLIYSIWRGPVIRAGNLSSYPTLHPEVLEDMAKNDRTLVSDGRFFLSTTLNRS
ncbi:hypothetical protein ZYGR_0W00290 [Zygosaccharomyces rouxii]|uniref:ZYRO0F16852p n=2 Tax=Zygosaccharomyces rouxii TaxID=4956 RepID=C5DYZ0_ZYGRC|nr:uncharacterized protein ZYRO0F16852g [Zygosaccharomyces rouxii]KAH9201287.1 NADPH dehydrogenase [Zygosaccharomyces rouxii]GAV50503.1 hypothetical protein ZYGR_0W00290 [Zygosaccharomyces rouxii]CAQ43373.1 NADPH dehydrogenase 2 and NADPH dehydrogenase 3 [Zygosaccharomyces rouxii]CAR29001.1 ZYRO0F16852p [Zygosaccharomyces rouxii]